MTILFFGRHFTYFRNFESVLRGLAARGHAIHLAVERDETFGGTSMVEALAAEYPNLTFGEAPQRADDDWAWAAGRLRLGLDYLRYQHPLFDSARKLRDRARGRTPAAFVTVGDASRTAGGWARHLASGLLRRVERAVPDEPAIQAFIAARRPDIVLLTPLVDLGSSQIDYLRAARALGIPTALCVWSWDHLSSKALIRDCPDRVFVWNETQKHEAMLLHGVPADRVVVTGAQCFDQWFDRQPSRGRDEFCRDVGFASAAPFILYVCSALFAGSPVEATFVVEWLRRLRADAPAALRDVPVLVRPHPSRTAEWQDVDLSGLNAVVWGSNPVDAQARADYFDSLYHSAAIVGINTSAFIEGGIVGRPVHTIVLPELADNQSGTVHFDYLQEVGGGLLEVAHSFDEHWAQLEQSLKAPPSGPKPFVQAFVRPHGRPATPIFVEQVEAMARLRVEPPGQAALAPVWRWAVDRVRRLRHDPRAEAWVLSEREWESVTRGRERAQLKALQRAEQRAAKDRHRQEVLQARAARIERERDEREARLREKQRRRAEKAQHAAARQRARSAARGGRLVNAIKHKLGFSSR